MLRSIGGMVSELNALRVTKIGHPRKVADQNRKLIYANEDTNDKCNIFIIPCTAQLWM